MRVLAFSLTALAATALVEASAQQPRDPLSACTCVAPLGPEGRPVGQFTAVNGSVSAFVSGGLTPARVGSQIALGTRVVTGARSTARVQVDGCVVDVPENADLEVSVVRNRICVALQQSGTPAGAGGAPGGVAGAVGGTIPPAAIAGGVLGLGAIGGIIAAGGGGNNGVVVVPPVSD